MRPWLRYARWRPRSFPSVALPFKSNIVERDEKHEVIEDLIIKLLQGCATQEEKKRIREWRRETAENEDHFGTLVRLWSITGAGQPALDELHIPDVDALIQRAATTPMDAAQQAPEARMRQPTSGIGRSLRSRHLRGMVTLLKVAAVGLLCISLGFGMGWLASGSQSVVSAMLESEIFTGDGEMTTITLQDGSSIRLGPRSRLRLRDEGETRVAMLQGRAFFGIAPDPSHPFVVRTEQGEVTVLGTRFEVRSEDVELRVLVVEGSVRVSSGGGATDLQAGEMCQSYSGEAPSVSTVEDVYADLAWMGNALVFQATPLSLAIREIELRYGVNIILKPPSLADLTISATLTNLQIDDVAMIVCEIIGARCYIDADTIRMKRDARDGIDPTSVRVLPRSAS